MLIILIKQTSRSNNKTTQHNNTGYVFLFDFSWGYILYIKYQLFYLSKCWSMCYSLFCCWRCGKYRGKSVDCILHRTLCLAIVFFLQAHLLRNNKKLVFVLNEESFPNSLSQRSKCFRTLFGTASIQNRTRS